MEDGALARAMMRSDAYPHAAPEVKCIETHISWVFLAGDLAYKVRKPVRFDFVDFSTLAARRADCEEELRLNRPLAPGLYLDVVPIARAGDGVRVGGSGAPLDYAVRMRRFPQRDLMAARIRAGTIDGAQVDALALRLADFHQRAPRAAVGDGHGTPERIRRTVEECLSGIAGQDGEDSLNGNDALASRLGSALRERAQALGGRFEARLRAGHVRECHGDLHLGNVVVLDGEAQPFDCLEFNAGLRWIDTISDIAFLFMDLIHHGRRDLAYRLLNAYLERGGDYAGLALLPFYAAMRALVRARVALERVRQAGKAEGNAAARARQADEYRALLALAEALLTQRRGAIVLMHGLSGSGKSTVAARLAERGGMIRVRADVERKRTASPPLGGWYVPAATARTYGRLLAACRLGARAGFPMIADATFLERGRRDRFARQAARGGTPFVIVDCHASLDTLRARVEARARAGNDPSDADVAVLERQVLAQEPLAPEERRQAVDAAEADALAARFG